MSGKEKQCAAIKSFNLFQRNRVFFTLLTVQLIFKYSVHPCIITSR